MTDGALRPARRANTSLQALRRAIYLLPLAMLACGTSALAQNAYHSRPIRIVVTFPPGGGPDIAACLVAAKLASNPGHTVTVGNRAGASGIIGAEHVARFAADGYTVMVGTPAPMSIAMAAGRKLNHSLKDFTGVTQGVLQTPLLVVAPDSPYKTAAELIAAAEGKPGALTFGSAGIGNSQHLVAELFNQMADINTLHVPYPGTALMAGLPIVTCMGQSFPAPVAGSLLHANGLPELVTHLLPDYEALVVDRMSDPEHLAGPRQRLLANRSTHALFDTARFFHNPETVFLDMLQQRFAAARLPPPASVVERTTTA